MKMCSDVLLRIKDRAECCKSTGLHEGDTAPKKTILGGGGHCTYFLDWMNNWGVEGWTPTKKVYWEGGTRTYFLDEGIIWLGKQYTGRGLHRKHFVDAGENWRGDPTQQ